MSTGTTYLRKDGRWETRVSLGVVDGKRQTKSFYGRTKEEAEGKMMAEVMNGMSFQITGLTVKALCMEWLSVNSHRVKISTQANYMTKMEKHILPYFDNKMCYEVTSKTVCGFIQAKLDEGLSAGYVSNILVLLNTVFKYAQKEYHILNPFDNVVMPKSTKSETRLLTKKEQKKLKEYLKSNVNTATLGISLAISMGLRIGEICGLTWQDIDFKCRTLTIRRTVQRIRVKGEAKKTKIVILPPKSKSSFREIPIPASVFAMLKLLVFQKLLIYFNRNIFVIFFQILINIVRISIIIISHHFGLSFFCIRFLLSNTLKTHEGIVGADIYHRELPLRAKERIEILCPDDDLIPCHNAHDLAVFLCVRILDIVIHNEIPPF